MARFYKFRNVAQAEAMLVSSTKAIRKFRDLCIERSREEETFFNFVTCCVNVNLAKEGGRREDVDKASKQLRDFVSSFEPYARRLAKQMSTQVQAIAFLKDNGVDAKDVARLISEGAKR